MIKPALQTIPNFNEPEYETLIQAFIQGTCIFIGAGVSKIAGYRLWDELRDSMVDYFWLNRASLPKDKRNELDLSTKYNLKEIKVLDALDFLSLISRELFNEGIKSIFYEDEENINNAIYEALKRISLVGDDINFFVTTNIDQGLQNSLSINDSDVSIFPDLSNPPKYINYLHGRIDIERSWILTTSQYHRGYVIDSMPCVHFLRNIFESYNVVFIGYGMGDLDLMNVLAITNKRKKHFWLEGWCRKTQDELRFRSTKFHELYNIQLVPYCIEDEEHEILFKVIDSLNKVISSRIS
jgi:hypothetical protein